MHSSFKADLVFLNFMSRRGFKKVMLQLGAVLAFIFSIQENEFLWCMGWEHCLWSQFFK